jgi:Domain of unknown function (DUF2382)
VRGLAVIMMHRTALQQDLAHHARSGQREGSGVATRLDDHRATVPVVEERAVVRKRKKVTGAVRVRTLVHRREEAMVEHLDGAGQVNDDPA